MIRGGQSHYVQAEFPPASIQEVKWSSVQRLHGDAKTPEELLAAIPDAAPVEGVVLRKMDGVEGCWMYNKEALDKVPHLNWGKLLQERAAACPQSQPPPETQTAASSGQPAMA